ncbi:MAG: hypothetical protein AB1791_18480 [Chloroflexota bacterium]
MDIKTQPTATPTPTRTPKATSASLTHYDLPAWVSDPDAAVLLALLSPELDGEPFISLLNPATGEHLDISALPHTWRLSWGQDAEGLFFQFRYEEKRGISDEDYVERIYVMTGEVRRLLASEVEQGREAVAPGGRHLARVSGWPESPATVTIEDRQTGRRVTLDDPFEGRLEWAEIEWSPTGDLLAVQRRHFVERGEPRVAALAIYDSDGGLFRQYNDLDGHSWAPDNSYQILYITGEEFPYYRPCLLDIKDNTTRCITDLVAWSESQAVHTSGYEWAPDGRHVSFVYWGRQDNNVAGLCTIAIEGGEVSCLVGKETIGEENFVHGYWWSPDGRYLGFIVSPRNPGSDDGTLDQLATVAGDGSQYRVWGSGHPPVLWRPAWEDDPNGQQ